MPKSRGSSSVRGPERFSANLDIRPELATAKAVALAPRNKAKLSSAAESDVIRRFLMGERVESIVVDYPIAALTVYGIAKRHGVKRPKKHPERKEPAWVQRSLVLFEDGMICEMIGRSVGVACKTVEAKASELGWKRRQSLCYKCDLPVPISGKRNSAARRVCAACEKARRDAKVARYLHLVKTDPDIRARHLANKRRYDKRAKTTPEERAARQQEWARKRAEERAVPSSQRGRFIRNGEPPHTREGALLILQATLRKLLQVRCDEQGVKLDTIEYKWRYANDAAFRERERLRTSGKRWGNRADGRDDGTLDKETVRKLFARAKTCPYCWHPMKSQDKTLDHMEPLSRGGWHSVKNVMVCCARCNSRKHDKPYDEWLLTIPQPCERALRERAA